MPEASGLYRDRAYGLAHRRRDVLDVNDVGLSGITNLDSGKERAMKSMKKTIAFGIVTGMMTVVAAGAAADWDEWIVASQPPGFQGRMGGFGGMMYVTDEDRPYIGIQLDPDPPSELLAKHLDFEPGQGLRITNVAKGSPADKAELERDDIIIEFQGKPVRGLGPFIDRIRSMEVGREVKLVVIHRGKRRTVRLELGAMGGRVEWKYPFEPEVETWAPGRLFRVPEESDEDWIEIPFGAMPPDLDTEPEEVRRFMHEIRTYHHVDDQGELTVTIVGDPRKEDSSLIVQADDTRIETTIGEIDKLPEKIRDRVGRIVEQAEEAPRVDMIRPPRIEMPRWRRFMEDMERRVPQPFIHREQWLEELQQRMDRMDERLEQMLQRLRQRHEEALPGQEAERQRLLDDLQHRMDRITEQMEKMQRQLERRQREVLERLQQFMHEQQSHEDDDAPQADPPRDGPDQSAEDSHADEAPPVTSGRPTT